MPEMCMRNKCYLTNDLPNHCGTRTNACLGGARGGKRNKPFRDKPQPIRSTVKSFPGHSYTDKVVDYYARDSVLSECTKSFLYISVETNSISSRICMYTIAWTGLKSSENTIEPNIMDEKNPSKATNKETKINRISDEDSGCSKISPRQMVCVACMCYSLLYTFVCV